MEPYAMAEVWRDSHAVLPAVEPSCVPSLPTPEERSSMALRVPSSPTAPAAFLYSLAGTCFLLSLLL